MIFDESSRFNISFTFFCLFFIQVSNFFFHFHHHFSLGLSTPKDYTSRLVFHGQQTLLLKKPCKKLYIEKNSLGVVRYEHVCTDCGRKCKSESDLQKHKAFCLVVQKKNGLNPKVTKDFKEGLSTSFKKSKSDQKSIKVKTQPDFLKLEVQRLDMKKIPKVTDNIEEGLSKSGFSKSFKVSQSIQKSKTDLKSIEVTEEPDSVSENLDIEKNPIVINDFQERLSKSFKKSKSDLKSIKVEKGFLKLEVEKLDIEKISKVTNGFQEGLAKSGFSKPGIFAILYSKFG